MKSYFRTSGKFIWCSPGDKVEQRAAGVRLSIGSLLLRNCALIVRKKTNKKNCEILLHLEPTSTGQAPCWVLLSPVPLRCKLYQKRAFPRSGLKACSMRGNTVSPPCSTSLSCQLIFRFSCSVGRKGNIAFHIHRTEP